MKVVQLREMIQLSIDPEHSTPPQPMLRLALAPGVGAAWMAYGRVDELIGELIKQRDIMEELCMKQEGKT